MKAIKRSKKQCPARKICRKNSKQEVVLEKQGNDVCCDGDSERTSVQVLSDRQASLDSQDILPPTKSLQELEGSSLSEVDMSQDAADVSLLAEVFYPTEFSEEQIVDRTGDDGNGKNPFNNKTKQAFFDITIGGVPSGRIIFELYDTIVPRTCENFMQLCTNMKGFGYKGTKFFTVMRGLCCKGGDIINNNGSDGKSVYGPDFDCENFDIKHDTRGILAMDKNGRGCNDSRFIVYTKPMPDRNGDIVAFGKVTEETYPIIEEIESMKCKYVRVGKTMYNTPSQDVMIANCGVL